MTDAYTKIGYRRSFGYHLERIRHLGLSGGVLIDAGCGGGRWSFAWATRFERVIGFDITPRRLDAAEWQRERFDIPEVEFLTGDVRKIPLDDQSADALYCNGVITGAHPVGPVLGEFFRVLKPGGVCYLGWNGEGLAHEQAMGDHPRLADLGRRRIYNTFCQRHLASLVDTIAPGGAGNVEIAACLQRGMTGVDLLTSLGCSPETIGAAQVIGDAIGHAFRQTLRDDIAAICTGAKAAFGDREAGRVWDADEMSAMAREAGFGRSEWAPEGWLSLKPDGSIEKAPSSKVRPGAHEFESRTRIFEMLLWKPAEKTSRGGRWPGLALVDQAIAEKPERTPDANWKIKVGSTTYWNGAPEDIVLPVIDSNPPGVIELQWAIITPREIEPKIDGPKEGRLRHAKGAIYDRDHNILPVFLEREAFEASMDKGNRLVNAPILPEEELVRKKKLKGRYVYLGILRGHFGHFLLESLCRVWFLLKHQPDLKVIVHADDVKNLPSYVKYIFKLLELELDRLIAVDRTLVVENLLFPESEFEIRWKAHSSYADTFRELFERSALLYPDQSTKPNRIYLTRRQLQIKNPRERAKVINNEADVEALFVKRGFTIIAPEKIPLHEQIALCGSAGQIAGLKGSALHMSLFAQRPNVRLIQIGRKQSMNQSLIDGAKGMDAHQILCESAPTKTGSVVDIKIIKSAVRDM